MTRTKICGITRVEDALAVARSGADALGLVFYEKSPRYVTVPQAAELARAVPPFVTVVGLFVNPTEDEVRDVLSQVPLDVLQFHGEETPEFCAQFGRPYLKAIRVRAGRGFATMRGALPGGAGIIAGCLHRRHAWWNRGESFDWALIPE